MKNSNCLFKIIAIFLALIVYSVFLFQHNESKETTPQPGIIEQQDINKSNKDSLKTSKSNVLLLQKDSTIQTLKAKLAKEKANTAIQKAEAQKQHILNDTLLVRYERDMNLNTCADLVRGLKLEVIEKDTVIQSLDIEIDNYSSEAKALEEKVDIQKGIINSKQNLIACKDSTIAFYKTQKTKADFWNKVKIKVAGAIVLIETIGLILK